MFESSIADVCIIFFLVETTLQSSNMQLFEVLKAFIICLIKQVIMNLLNFMHKITPYLTVFTGDNSKIPLVSFASANLAELPP